jgi:hypothetical protein
MRWSGFQPSSATFGKLWCGHVEQHVGAGRLQLDDVGIDARLQNVKGFLGHDHRCGLVAQAFLHALEVILPEVIVLKQDGNLCAWLLLQKIFRVGAAFILVARGESHRPWEIRRVVPLRRPARDEQLRHLLGVQIFLDRGIRRRAQRVEDEENFVAFNQLPRLFDGLRRRVGVVVRNKPDLAAIDTAFSVDLPHIGFAGFRHHAEGRCRAAIGRGISDLDFAVGDARAIFLLAGGYLTGESKERCRDGEASRNDHDFLPSFYNFCGRLLSGSAGPIIAVGRRIR